MSDIATDPAIVMPEPGFHLDVSYDEYASWDAMNQSTLCKFEQPPAKVLHDLHSGGKKRTLALDMGLLLHLAVLEPERFRSSVVVPPLVGDYKHYPGAGSPRRKKEEWIRWSAEYPEGEWTYVDAGMLRQVTAMADSVLSHETAGPFFSGRGEREISALWNDDEHGVKCKGRLDKVVLFDDWPALGDLKSSRDASRRAFERSIEEYQYHVQAAHYLAGCEAIAPIETGSPFRRFFFIVVESVPPYLTAFHEIQDDALEEGRLRRSRYIRKWKECIETGVWPGYPAHEYVSLPPWAFKNYIDE